MHGRFLIMLVVLATVVASRQPAFGMLAPEQRPVEQTRSAWIDRLSVGLTRTITRMAMLQRVTLQQPSPRLAFAAPHTTRAVVPEVPNPFRFCLPPPQSTTVIG